MLNEQTAEKLESMRLLGMAKAFREMTASTKGTELSNTEFVGLLADTEKTYRENQKLQRLLQGAKLKQQACTEDIDYRNPRGLTKQVIMELSMGDWINRQQNVLISGPTGVGKSFIACAIGNSCCRLGYSVHYVRAPILFTTLYQSMADGSYLKQLNRLSRINVLIIDDLGITPMVEHERKDLFGNC